MYIPPGEKIVEEKVCALSGQNFVITDQDQYLYKKIGPRFGEQHFPIPFPDMCPDMRYMNRLSWRNERNFYSRKCSISGQQIVSIHPEDVAFPVLDQDIWWSDEWSPYDHGQRVSFDRPFFEQFAELYAHVPQIALNAPHSENSKYCNQSQRLKDCYITFCSDLSEKCYYGMWNNNSERCLDCSYIKTCQNCYEGLNLDACNSCFFSEDLINCSDVWYSKNLTGCQQCFGCCNLVNKKFHIFNEPIDETQYFASVEKLKASPNVTKKMEDIVQNQPHKYYHGFQIEASTGDYIRNIKQAHNCYNCRDSEYLRHSQDAHQEKHCIDLTETIIQDYCISIEGCCNTSNCGFCMKINDSSDLWYSSHIYGSKKVFGSVGIKSGRNVIFNTVYSAHEYEELCKKLTTHMLSTGEFGKHFPTKDSPFSYNITTAQEYFPMTASQAESLGFSWSQDEEVSGSQMPELKDISQYDERVVGRERARVNMETLLGQTLICEITHKPFRLQKRELAFYIENRLPIPRLHPNERYQRRMTRRNARKLYPRICDKCSGELQSTYSSTQTEKIYCEKCYRETVY